MTLGLVGDKGGNLKNLLSSRDEIKGRMKSRRVEKAYV
jgi:hypothetical protein